MSGVVDIHIHGQAGFDAMSRNPDDLLQLSLQLKRRGTAGFLATFISSQKKDILASLETLKKVRGREKGARILGVHLEGPFLHPARQGAHNTKNLRLPSVKEAREWVAAGEGLVKLVTLAPELPGMGPVIRFLTKKGVRVSMGHTTADSAQALRAKRAGVKSVTHLFNAMNSLHHREPGLAGFSLLDRDIYTELIADGVHVSDDTVRLVLRTRPHDRIILISDGCLLSGREKKGSYTFGGTKVTVRPDGSLRMADGTLAGGNSTLSDIVRRVVRISGLSRSKVLAMATANPLRMLGLHAPR